MKAPKHVVAGDDELVDREGHVEPGGVGDLSDMSADPSTALRAVMESLLCVAPAEVSE